MNSHVLETHVHNDYVSGGLELARTTRADYVLSAAEDVAFEHVGVADGEVLRAGALTVTARHTPGHTFHHLAYEVRAGGAAIGLFSGGSLLFGSAGRPDLLGPEAAPFLARAQHRSARRLAALVPPDTALYPTHGFGSFCAATETTYATSTIGHECAVNPALTLPEDDYVRELLGGLGAYPAYYAHMAPANRSGPGPIDLTPPAAADAAELGRRLDRGEWVVDLRDRTIFARGHVSGTVNVGLSTSFATYLGWLLPWGTPVTLLGATAEDVSAAHRELVRIGIDRPVAMATGDPLSWSRDGLASLPTADFAALAAARCEKDVVVLDVRRDEERRVSRVAGALHVPLHELRQRLDEIPDPPVEVWVHCQVGYRAAIAASILAAAARRVVLVDDDYSNAAAFNLLTSAAAGLPTEGASLR